MWIILNDCSFQIDGDLSVCGFRGSSTLVSDSNVSKNGLRKYSTDFNNWLFLLEICAKSWIWLFACDYDIFSVEYFAYSGRWSWTHKQTVCFRFS